MRDQVKQLTLGSEAAGSPEIQVIVDLAVGRFGVTAPTHEALVVGIPRGDLADVLGAVELTVLFLSEGGFPDGAAFAISGRGQVVFDVCAVRTVGIFPHGVADTPERNQNAVSIVGPIQSVVPSCPIGALCCGDSAIGNHSPKGGVGPRQAFSNPSS
jgi:hypothetical protein